MIFGLKWLILGWDGKLIDLKSFLPPFTSFLPHMCRKKSPEKKKDFVCNVEWKMVWNVERKCRLVFLKKWTRYRKLKKTQFPLTPSWILLLTISFKEKKLTQEIIFSLWGIGRTYDSSHLRGKIKKSYYFA